MHSPHNHSRVLDLMADHALEGLAPFERDELESLLGEPIRDDAVTPMEVTASALTLAMLAPRDVLTMPASLERRLLDSANRWCENAQHGPASGPVLSARMRSDAGPQPKAPARPLANGLADSVRSHPRRDGRPAESVRPIPMPARSNRLPWLLVAASLALAAVGWMQAMRAAPSGSVPLASDQIPTPSQLLAQAGDTFTATFADWDSPEVKGVQGEVTWSDAAQTGVMRFTNLPLRSGDRYQLWIVDSRGMEQRISGGVFNGGDCSVSALEIPIKPGIEVVAAAAFAITIERPEGVWVSDMKRRVAIAKRS